MRSVSKNLVLDREKIIKKKINREDLFLTRRSVITSNLVGLKIKVYNGKQLIQLKVKKSMIGHKVGEFAFTRKIYQYKKGKKGKK
uniref:Ribosomal protein S19 n=1 Tax=Pharyngomonas kirbyi TaxID=63601 RepID=A0A1W6R264_9EUKA|nr:ribosomal protein S19 [Pharyngomonas kirbyi]ARO47979.1 ribosomal protein S19 [Pharyngomonas kirbyi]